MTTADTFPYPTGQVVGVLVDQATFADARRYAEHLRAGHYLIGVAVGEDEAAKQRAADALRAAHAESVDYFGENHVETLTS